MPADWKKIKKRWLIIFFCMFVIHFTLSASLLFVRSNVMLNEPWRSYFSSFFENNYIHLLYPSIVVWVVVYLVWLFKFSSGDVIDNVSMLCRFASCCLGAVITPVLVLFFFIAPVQGPMLLYSDVANEDPIILNVEVTGFRTREFRRTGRCGKLVFFTLSSGSNKGLCLDKIKAPKSIGEGSNVSLIGRKGTFGIAIDEIVFNYNKR